MATTNTFRYFAFGSNLLKERIQLKNPSARFIDIAKLVDYRLGFDMSGGRWKGCAATIHQSLGDHVWGCLWEVHNDNMKSLDEQEGVSSGIYCPLEVEVTTQSGQTLSCRTYQLLKLGSSDKRPSPQYMDVIVTGAKQNGLPQDYVQQLEKIEHNGYCGKCEVYEQVMALLKK